MPEQLHRHDKKTEAGLLPAGGPPGLGCASGRAVGDPKKMHWLSPGWGAPGQGYPHPP